MWVACLRMVVTWMIGTLAGRYWDWDGVKGIKLSPAGSIHL
jgi:hypothetical protein